MMRRAIIIECAIIAREDKKRRGKSYDTRENYPSYPR